MPNSRSSTAGWVAVRLNEVASSCSPLRSGQQRQNLNEVENLYFHHSHLRSIRQSAGQRPHYATPAYPPAPAPLPVLSPAPSAVPDRTAGSSPSVNDASSSGSVSPPSQSPSEHSPGAAPSSQPQPYPPLQAPVPLVPSSTSTNRPPAAFDLSDPNILARLAQLQAQVQIPSQSQAQILLRQPSTTIPPSTSTSTSTSTPASQPIPIPIPAPVAFPPHIQPSQPGIPFSAYVPQPVFGTSTPGPVPLYPVPAAHPAPTSHNPTVPSQPPVLLPASTSTSPPVPNTPIPASTTIAPSALTYDSFWSTHASSTGPTRALYRTHTGFTASATPGGNVAMLTPGGHAAVMTAEGVYVGGASNRSG